MADAYLLLPELKKWLDDFRAQWERRLGNTTGRAGVEFDEHQAPEVYVARTPALGISPLSVNTTGTSPTADIDDVTSFGICEVYRIIEDPDGALLQPVTGLTKRVYNLSTGTLPGDTLILVARDKFGNWIAVTAGGGLTTQFDVMYNLECVGGVPTAYFYTLTFTNGLLTGIQF